MKSEMGRPCQTPLFVSKLFSGFVEFTKLLPKEGFMCFIFITIVVVNHNNHNNSNNKIT